MTHVIVNVHLKSEILDPQGKAILGALTRQGIEELSEVRQGKQFVLKFENDLSAEAQSKLQHLVAEFLTNPVIEDFSIEVKNES